MEKGSPSKGRLLQHQPFAIKIRLVSSGWGQNLYIYLYCSPKILTDIAILEKRMLHTKVQCWTKIEVLWRNCIKLLTINWWLLCADRVSACIPQFHFIIMILLLIYWCDGVTPHTSQMPRTPLVLYNFIDRYWIDKKMYVHVHHVCICFISMMISCKIFYYFYH